MAEEYFVGTNTSDRYPIWTRANVGEVFPDPVALSTFDFAFQNDDGIQMSELGFRDAYIRIGAFEESEFDPDNPVFLGVFGGYTYLNASLMRISVSALLVFQHKISMTRFLVCNLEFLPTNNTPMT